MAVGDLMFHIGEKVGLRGAAGTIAARCSVRAVHDAMSDLFRLVGAASAE